MMRKLFLSLLVFVSVAQYSTDACTNFLVTKGASADGSTLISYAADSHDLYGELYHWKAQKWAPNAMLDVYEWDTGKYLGEIKQAPETYNVVGNMNEFQLTIAETTFGGRSELRDTTGIIDYGSLIYITLQRAKTAREAIQTMTSLVEEYGYYSSGESFSIADPNEVWIMEMIGKGVGNKGAVWVARKIPDGMISGHANQSRITTFPLNDENTLYSKDVIDFAKEQGYYKGKDKNFSFSEAYAPIDFGAQRFCEARVWSGFKEFNPEYTKYEYIALGESKDRLPLWIKPSKKVSYRDIQNIMRDHYEGTSLDMTEDIGSGPFNSPYRFRPMEWEVDGQKYLNERAIATQQTGFSFVAQMRSWLPNEIGGVLWFGVDDAATSVYVPMYCSITHSPAEFAVGNGDLITFDWNSAFWVFNWVSNTAYGRYQPMIGDIKEKQLALEDEFEQFSPILEAQVQKVLAQDRDKAIAMLNDYSDLQSTKTLQTWKKLGEFLMVKFLDGNLHEEKDGKFLRNENNRPVHAQFPGYNKEYYKNVAEKTGDKLKVKDLK